MIKLEKEEIDSIIKYLNEIKPTKGSWVYLGTGQKIVIPYEHPTCAGFYVYAGAFKARGFPEVRFKQDMRMKDFDAHYFVPSSTNFARVNNKDRNLEITKIVL